MRMFYWRAILVSGLVAVAGCGDRANTSADPPTPTSPRSVATGSSQDRSPEASRTVSPGSAASGDQESGPTESVPDRKRPDGQERSLSDLLLELEDGTSDSETDSEPEIGQAPAVVPLKNAGGQPLVAIDLDKLRQFGIRELKGEHFTLYTDVKQSREVDELPTVFDAAVKKWIQYFDLEPGRLADWHVKGFLIKDKRQFKALQLLPSSLPPFLNGYQAGNHIWFYEQPTAYYRRHLMIHEGTHALMFHVFGSAGPPWYMEGMAELLGTHRWDRTAAPDEQLMLAYFPQDKQETPHWGRIKIVQDEFAANRGMSLPAILLYPPSAHLKNEPYGWCWAAASFFDNHPAYQESFRQLTGDLAKPDFNQLFFERNEARWWQIEIEWQLFLSRVDYGYDIAAEAVKFQDGVPLESAQPRVVETDVAAGWQSTGVQLEEGQTYRLESLGRYQIAQEDEGTIWWCEPAGVTLEYYRGAPLGTVLAAVHPDHEPPRQLTLLARPLAVGLDATLRSPITGTLYLRANDSPTRMSDNKGSFHTRITPQVTDDAGSRQPGGS